MDNPLHEFPGYLLRRAAAARMAELSQRLAPLRLTVSEASVVAVIADNPGLSQTEVGRMLAIQRANMNPMVRRLSERGIVLMRQGNGRALGLTLSKEGRVVADAIVATFLDHEAGMMARVPEDLRPMVAPVLMALWAPRAGEAVESE